MDGVVGEQVDGWLGEHTSEQIRCWWAGEWMDGWAGERMDDWLVGLIYLCQLIQWLHAT